MFDPNNPAPPQVPGQMQTMGFGGGGQPQAGGGRWNAFPAPGSVPTGGPPSPPPVPGATPVAGDGRFGGLIQSMGGMNHPNVQAILQALQGFRDARMAWRQGGRVGARPTLGDYWGGWGSSTAPNPAVSALNGTSPAAPTQIAPANMVGSSLAVPGAAPATGGFDLPDY